MLDATTDGVASGTAALRAGEVVRIRDEQWRVVGRANYDAASVVEVVGCDSGNHNRHSRFIVPFETIERFTPEEKLRLVSRRRWRRAARRVLAESLPWASLWSAARADIRLVPFQFEPALALVRGDGCRFLIADAVGLGKTVQAGLMVAEMLARRPDARALVVAPAALRDQWRQELQQRFRIEADVLDSVSTARLLSQLPASVNPWSVSSIAVTSIDYVKRPEVMRSLETLSWDVVVFDEAHNLAGRSDRSAAAHALGQRARVVVLLTATPHSGNDEAFDRLCNLGAFDRKEPLLVFRRTRAGVGLLDARRERLLRLTLSPGELAMHTALMSYAQLVWQRSSRGSGARLAVSVLVRRACSSAASLARSVERRLALLAEDVPAADDQPALPFMDAVVDDDEPWQLLRARGLSDVDEERWHLRHLLDLTSRVGTADAKFSALRRLVARAGEPAIVFTEYRDTLRELSGVFAEQKTVELHGGLTNQERREALAHFTRGTANVLLATDAASEGLNLHERCRLVINLEVPWTPVRLEQRAGRVDRIGQARRVHVVHLVAGGTCEEATLAHLKRRMERARDAMGPMAGDSDEHQIAQSILGNQPLESCDNATSPGRMCLSTVDLRDEARREVENNVQTRLLIDEPSSQPVDRRGVVVRLRRRRGLARHQGFLVFRVTVSAGSGQVVSEPLVILRTDLVEAPLSRADIRQRLAQDHPLVLCTLQVARDRALDTLRAALERSVAPLARREQQMVAHVCRHQARLAAVLAQRSLFDSRVERLAASQAALTEEAVSRSHQRLRELESFGAVDVDAIHLALAALIG